MPLDVVVDDADAEPVEAKVEAKAEAKGDEDLRSQVRAKRQRVQGRMASLNERSAALLRQAQEVHSPAPDFKSDLQAVYKAYQDQRLELTQKLVEIATLTDRVEQLSQAAEAEATDQQEELERYQELDTGLNDLEDRMDQVNVLLADIQTNLDEARRLRQRFGIENDLDDQKDIDNYYGVWLVNGMVSAVHQALKAATIDEGQVLDDAKEVQQQVIGPTLDAFVRRQTDFQQSIVDNLTALIAEMEARPALQEVFTDEETNSLDTQLTLAQTRRDTTINEALRIAEQQLENSAQTQRLVQVVIASVAGGPAGPAMNRFAAVQPFENFVGEGLQMFATYPNVLGAAEQKINAPATPVPEGLDIVRQQIQAEIEITQAVAARRQPAGLNYAAIMDRCRRLAAEWAPAGYRYVIVNSTNTALRSDQDTQYLTDALANTKAKLGTTVNSDVLFSLCGSNLTRRRGRRRQAGLEQKEAVFQGVLSRENASTVVDIALGKVQAMEGVYGWWLVRVNEATDVADGVVGLIEANDRRAIRPNTRPTFTRSAFGQARGLPDVPANAQADTLEIAYLCARGNIPETGFGAKRGLGAILMTYTLAALANQGFSGTMLEVVSNRPTREGDASGGTVSASVAVWYHTWFKFQRAFAIDDTLDLANPQNRRLAVFYTVPGQPPANYMSYTMDQPSDLAVMYRPYPRPGELFNVLSRVEFVAAP